MIERHNPIRDDIPTGLRLARQEEISRLKVAGGHVEAIAKLVYVGGITFVVTHSQKSGLSHFWITPCIPTRFRLWLQPIANDRCLSLSRYHCPSIIAMLVTALTVLVFHRFQRGFSTRITP